MATQVFIELSWALAVDCYIICLQFPHRPHASADP